MASVNPILSNSNTNGGVGLSLSGVPVASQPVTTPPQDLFDISVLSGLRDSDKYQGKNRVSDIKEVYQTYLSGSSVGRGGTYAQDILRRYSSGLTATYGEANLQTAAKNYLESIGFPKLSQVFNSAPNPVNTSNPVAGSDPVNTPVTRNPFEILADIIPSLFGNAVYNPPLQNQSSGFTGIEQGTPLAESTGGNIGTFIVIGVIGVIAYFLYKRFAG